MYSKIKFMIAILFLSNSLLFAQEYHSPSKEISIAIDDLDIIVKKENQHVLSIQTPWLQFSNGGEVKIQKISKPQEVNLKFATRGYSNEIESNYNEISIFYSQGIIEAELVIRIFDSGIAFQNRYSKETKYSVTGDSTRLIFPDSPMIWHQKHQDGYEADWKGLSFDAMEDGYAAGMPITVKSNFFILINESNIYKTTGGTALVKSGNSFSMFFPKDIEPQLFESGFNSTWKSFEISKDLNGIINNKIIKSCAPQPDKELFPEGLETEWIKNAPGRTMWQWWAYWDAGTYWFRQKAFVRNAARLNCKYYLVDAGWENPLYGWTDKNGKSWTKLKELCDYAKQYGVEIMVWRPHESMDQGPGLETEALRNEFFHKIKECGVKGIKIDYFGSESKKMLEFYNQLSRLAAENQILINFHGANKGAGEDTTWPNEVTREGIKGLEHLKWGRLNIDHYLVLPFTRLAGGHGDFTPTTLQPAFLKGTTKCFQLASAIVYHSPVLTWADKPGVYLRSKALELIRTIPTVSEETIVHDFSKIGKTAGFSRLYEGQWFTGIMNHDNEKVINLDCKFLAEGSWLVDIYEDHKRFNSIITRTEAVTQTSSIDLELKSTSGAVLRFYKLKFKEQGGLFGISKKIELCSIKGSNVKVYYTLDGSAPTTNSTEYNQPFTIYKTTQVRAILLEDEKPVATIEQTFYKK
ncbi:MAG: glycoside hydrolase family 97 catalytic domain-containing protein [Spirochaetales bacterium]|nr:glycoside hydrolase family 97 catalytic domain-containing protein [Spirochaetales bacterium]